MASAVIKLSAILLLVAACAADVSELAAPVTEVCLGCICQAVSGCKQGLACEGDACGLFRITWAYWSDAGKPTVRGQSPDAPDAYPNCTNDPYCAAVAVQGYMRKFAQDCNGDGRIDCYDYMAIHKKGGYGCVGELPFNYVNVFNQCVAAVAQGQYYVFFKSATIAFAVIKLSAILLLVAACAADVSPPVTDACLRCICQAISGCRTHLKCEGEVCGMFRITKPFWLDAGRPTIYGQSPDARNAFRKCSNEAYCAARAVQGYMTRFAQDCNGDGHVDCKDYMAIHMKGGYGCTGELPTNYVNVFNQCIASQKTSG